MVMLEANSDLASKVRKVIILKSCARLLIHPLNLDREKTSVSTRLG